MQHIITLSPGKAWLSAVKEVLEKGHYINDGKQRLKEILNMMITISDPLQQDDIIRNFGDKKMIKWMVDNFLNKNNSGDNKFSYGKRIYSFHGINQINKVIEKLKDNPESKSAIITLLNPPEDNDHVPCIVAIDFKIRNKKLITTAFFRSQDVSKKLYADIIAIGKTSKKIAESLHIKCGEQNILAVSMHAYETDWGRMTKLLSLIYPRYGKQK